MPGVCTALRSMLTQHQGDYLLVRLEGLSQEEIEKLEAKQKS